MLKVKEIYNDYLRIVVVGYDERLDFTNHAVLKRQMMQVLFSSQTFGHR